MQDRGGGKDIGVAEVEWRKAETHVIGIAEVADHTALDEGLHDLVSMRVAKRDLAAAHCPLARRRQGYAEGAATFLDKGDKKVREPKTLLAQLIEVDLVPDLKRAGKCAHGKDRLCPARPRANSVARSEAAIERERTGMAPPARERLRELAMMAPGGEDKGRRAGAAVQVLVRTANGEIGAGGIEVNPQHADAMTKIPNGDGPCIMNAARQRGHVAQHAGAVVYVVDEHHADLVAEQVLNQRGIDPLQLYAQVRAHAGHALGHIDVGWEGGAFGD